jgi:RES domain
LNTNPPTLEELQSIAESIRGTNLRARSHAEVEAQLNRLIGSHEAVGIARTVDQTWYRARPALNEHGFSNVSELIHPKDGSPNYGRASMPNQSVLYASWNLLTALEEVRAEPGQFVQLISLRVRSGIQFPCEILGECHSVFQSGGSLINSRILEHGIRQCMSQPNSRVHERVFVDAFLAEQFSRRAEHHSEYKVTATYAHRVLQARRGLMFPSVQAQHNINLAISASDFAESFEVMGSLLVRIERYAGYGLFITRLVRQTHTIDKTGNFVWESTSRIPYAVHPAGGRILDPMRKGWRVGDA